MPMTRIRTGGVPWSHVLHSWIVHTEMRLKWLSEYGIYRAQSLCRTWDSTEFVETLVWHLTAAARVDV